MQAELRSLLVAPFTLWRTMLLVFVTGLLVARISQDATAVLLISMACAFVLSGFERRRWIVISMQTHAADFAGRVIIALLFTYLICNTQYSRWLPSPLG